MARSVYARIQDVRASGLTDVIAYPDARVQTLLEIASARVEGLTNQYFGPRRLNVIRSGDGRRLVQEKNSNKIIELETLSLVSPSGGGHVIESRYYFVAERSIRLRWTFDGAGDLAGAGGNFNALTPSNQAFVGIDKRRFPDNDGNVRLQGTFGWIEKTTRFETTLGADLARGDLQVTLTAAAGVEDNDLLLIGDDEQAFWVIAGADPTALVVPIDPSPKAALSGAKVVRYGQVMLLLREAVVRTALANRFMPGSVEELDLQNSRRVRREETDNYEVEFFAAPAGGKAASGTGDPIADAILSDFQRPRLSLRHV